MSNNALNIRIVADTQEDIFVDFNINKDCSFKDIHDFLITKFNLDELEMSSFYYSNDQWDKGEEITLMNMNFENENTIKFMEATLLKAVFEEGNFKFLYVNDFLNMNIFYFEILKESNINNNNKVAVLHELGNYTPNVGNVNNEVSNDVNTSKTNEIEDILNEYNEDDLNKFEELDEDLY